MRKSEAGFSLLEKQILALHYNGTYINNFEFQKIAKSIGIDLDLSDREKMLKNLIKKVKEEHKERPFIATMTKFLQGRIKQYEELLASHPQSKEIVMPYIQKTRSTILLLQQRFMANPYA